jgi:hypothetical protein
LCMPRSIGFMLIACVVEHWRTESVSAVSREGAPLCAEVERKCGLCNWQDEGLFYKLARKSAC